LAVREKPKRGRFSFNADRVIPVTTPCTSPFTSPNAEATELSIPPTPEFGIVARVIRDRRTNMVVDRERPVPRELVRELCDLAQWAPNHKRTWPWRFALVEGTARSQLGQTIADAMEKRGDPPEKVAKTRGKYLRTPATLVVGSVVGDTLNRSAENRDAVAAGVQTLLLGATAAGLATYWGSCPDGAHAQVVELCGFEPETHISALIYLGWPLSSPEAPARPPVALTILE
jgi:nitroreductase